MDLEEEELKKKAEAAMYKAWSVMGHTGEPTIICIYCRKPCEWDKEKDIIICKKCGRDWTLESMKDECEKYLGKK